MSTSFGQVSRRVSRGAWITALLVLVFSSSAFAVHAPHITDAVGLVYFNSFDTLMPAGGGVPALGTVTAGGPCGVAGGAFAFFACGFFDPFNLVNTYAWETGIHNPNPGPLIANLGFFFPGGPILGTLVLTSGHTFHINIGVQDSLLFPTDRGTGIVWYAWAGAIPIFVDAAVIEATAGFNAPGFFTFHFHSDEECTDCSFVEDPTLNVAALDFSYRHPDFRQLARSLVPGVPEPSAAALLAAGALILLAGARRRAAGR